MPVGQDAHEGLCGAPHDVLQGNGQRKIGGRDADLADHVRLQQAKALAHAHGQTQHHGGAAHDQSHMESGQVCLFHGGDYFHDEPIAPPVGDTDRFLNRVQSLTHDVVDVERALRFHEMSLLRQGRITLVKSRLSR